MTIKILSQRLVTGNPFFEEPDQVALEIAISQDDQTWYRLDVGGIPPAADAQAALDARFSELIDVALNKGHLLDKDDLQDKDQLLQRWQASPFAGLRPAEVFQIAQTTVDGWKSTEDIIATLRVWLPLLLADIAHRGNQNAKS